MLQQWRALGWDMWPLLLFKKPVEPNKFHHFLLLYQWKFRDKYNRLDSDKTMTVFQYLASEMFQPVMICPNGFISTWYKLLASHQVSHIADCVYSSSRQTLGFQGHLSTSSHTVWSECPQHILDNSFSSCSKYSSDNLMVHIFWWLGGGQYLRQALKSKLDKCHKACWLHISVWLHVGLSDIVC